MDLEMHLYAKSEGNPLVAREEHYTSKERSMSYHKNVTMDAHMKVQNLMGTGQDHILSRFSLSFKFVKIEVSNLEVSQAYQSRHFMLQVSNLIVLNEYLPLLSQGCQTDGP